jgi:cell division transport system permease protein
MRFLFVVQEVSTGIKRNLSIFISVILVTLISFTFVGAGVLLQMQISQAKDEWYDKVEVSVWMCPNGGSDSASCSSGEEASEQEIANLVAFLTEQMSDEVDSVYVESKAELFAELEREYPGGVVEGQQLTPDDMQVVLRVKLIHPENYQVIADVLVGRAGVEQVQDQRSLFEPTFNLLNALTVVTLGVAIIMLVAAVLLITATIRLSANSRKDQTQIMRLSGATNAFIQLPFLLEGTIAATIGSVLSIGFLTLAIQFGLQGFLAAQMPWMDFLSISAMTIVGPLLFGAAVLLAILASVVSLRKYTKI